MTVADRSSGRRRSAHGRRRETTLPSGAGRSRLPVSVVALSAATGVLAVAAADTAGRLGHAATPWADWLYWLGQALIVVPVAARMLSRRARTAAETVSLVVVLTVAEYLVKICYSPAAFTYSDELEHWRSTLDILQTGKLFTVNYLLPISPHYPGLEEITTAVVSITGLPIYTAGLIVIGTAHLLFVCLLYLIFRHVSGSDRLAGIAVVFYACNPDFQSFDSMFVYQAAALPFLALALLATWRLTSPAADGGRGRWLTVGTAAILATVVTHHVTSYMLTGALLVITVASLLAGGREAARWPALMTVVSLLATVGWLVFAAPETVTYLKPFADGVLQSLHGLVAGGASKAPPVSSGPLSNFVLAALAIPVMSLLIPVAWLRVWRTHRREPWLLAMALGSVGWYGIIAVRLVVADGSELAGRASTFVYVPAGCMAALAVVHLAGAAVRWQARAAATAVLAGMLLMMFDGLVNGWPPYWERLPGPHQVAGSERSVGPQEVASARWALAALGPGHRFATDLGDYPVLGSYGDQNPIRDVAYLYTSPTFTALDAQRVQAQSIQYVLVDRRLSEALPASGQYFPVDPNAGRYHRPLPLPALEKFSNIPGVNRIYDGGDIVIYDLQESAHAP